MLHEKTRDHIRGLGDAELLEYVLTGRRMYDREAIAFAREELEHREIPPEQIEEMREPIVAKLRAMDAQSPPNLASTSGSAILCQYCGMEAPNRKAEYYQNIGALVVRFSKAYEGCFCRRCNHKLFWETMLINFFLGWWGVISFFMTIVYLLNNVMVFLRNLSIPAAPPGARPPTLDDRVISKITPHVGLMMDRLDEGTEWDDIAREVAPLANVTPGEAWFFLQYVVRPQMMMAAPPAGGSGFPVLQAAQRPGTASNGNYVIED